MFVRNAWYVAALDAELTDQLLPVKLLNERVVLYRQTNGNPVALEDACAHRKLPLSMGSIQGDHVMCGYHGLRYDRSGACVHMPCADRIPKGARVRSYPVVARYGLLWIWMGPAELVNESEIFEVEHWGDPSWGVTRGDAMTVNCHYLYMTDNLLDPSHVAWVHLTTFGNTACEATPIEVQASDQGVIASRWMRSVEPAPLYVPFLGFKGHCDRLQHYEVRYPSNALIKAVLVPAGVGGPDASQHPAAFVMDSYNFLTPVDATQTRYFWFQMRNVLPHDEHMSTLMANGVRFAFEEDRRVLNAVQQGFDESMTPNIDIATDAAPLRFRRRVQTLMDKEKSAERV